VAGDEGERELKQTLSIQYFNAFELISLCIDYIQSLHFIRWIIGNQLFKITSILLTLMKSDEVVKVSKIETNSYLFINFRW